MTTDAISESGMTFGPYPEGHCFHIEKSECYKKIQKGVQMAEFLLLKQQQHGMVTVWVVEAKSSSPRPETQTNFNAFIDEIRIKMTNGFLLTVAAQLQRHPASKNQLPDAFFKKLNLQKHGFRFVLVINGHQPDWLVPLQNALMNALMPIVKMWALPTMSVAVLNHDQAQTYGLIAPTAGAAP